ncbi:hypothetical protein COMA2_10435 [Candidatus Nitrospira nitrificans]|uniref:Uncharacterized protein n=1 Tax=Candidatus Nitrospira nitrificans TaxID=1742973 RepID=A0A0S4L5I4_9BACT|nr:hypothetical protein COMA2_10435 [Candidatus Nitrospira nitrificans]
MGDGGNVLTSSGPQLFTDFLRKGCVAPRVMRCLLHPPAETVLRVP